ncbi:MAG: DNA primase noncatalytic subunit PriX [Desulfurococcales archaeon]|nr:DNA primase noncatalytic subunit PriX [Desulfurococcales archaeon]
MAEAYRGLVEACLEGEEACREAVRRFLSEMCSDPRLCEAPRGYRRLLERYSWVERIIEKGVPDGRARLILYVISRYLVNVKRLDIDEALLAVKQFIQNSCKNFNNCSKIYDSWIRNVLRSVSQGGWLPWSLDRLKERDPSLYDVVASLVEE